VGARLKRVFVARLTPAAATPDHPPTRPVADRPQRQ